MATELKHAGSKWWIEGAPPYEVCEALFEAVRVALTQHGAPYSANYIQGISGAAFRIGGICPCAPTCDYAMEVWELLDLLGFNYQRIWVSLGEVAGGSHAYEVLMPLAQSLPVGDHIDPDGLVRHITESLGVPKTTLRSQREVDETRQQRAAAEQEAMERQALSQDVSDAAQVAQAVRMVGQ